MRSTHNAGCDLLLNLYLWRIKHTRHYPYNASPWLWFAFKFVSLTYQTHSREASNATIERCDLLLNLYLWRIKHTSKSCLSRIALLWFAFKFVSLTYQTHFHKATNRKFTSCDLLLNLYLWRIKHTVFTSFGTLVLLWFAFKFVSLTYQTHCVSYPRRDRGRCDLLLNLYLWRIKHTGETWVRNTDTLWFAFKFVSLTYQTHLHAVRVAQVGRCDLLLNLYLWRIKHT